MGRRRVAACAAFLAGSLVLAGCTTAPGDPATEPQPSDPSVSAPHSPPGATTPAPSTGTAGPHDTSPTTSDKNAPPTTSDKNVPPTKSGATVDGTDFDQVINQAMLAKRTYHLRQTMKGVRGAGAFDITGQGKGMWHVTVPSLGRLDARMIGDTTWVKGLPDSPATWAVLKPGSTDPNAQLWLALIGTSTLGANYLVNGMLTGLTGRVVTGEKNPSGHSAMEYRFRVPLQRYIAKLGPLGQALSQQFSKGPVTIDYWIDTDHLPAAIEIHQHTASGNTTVLMLFSEWGTPVTVTPPPADQVGPPPDFGNSG